MCALRTVDGELQNLFEMRALVLRLKEGTGDLNQDNIETKEV